MRALIAVAAVVSILAWTAPAADAGSVLFEWALNIDGTVSDSLAGDPVPAGANTAGFDFTTGLGTMLVTVSGAGLHYVSLFLDHEIDEAINGFTNEYGEALGVPAAGKTWEIDEPGYVFGNIFANFGASALDNTNAVPIGAPDDVSMAAAWAFTLAAGETATVTLAVSTTDPGGFRLAQTDPASAETIYFRNGLTITGDGQVPEPASGVLLLIGAGVLGLAVRMRRGRPH